MDYHACLTTSLFSSSYAFYRVLDEPRHCIMSSKVSMPSKIFGTVLSHGLRGRMLTKGELQTLAESRDMEELVTRTKNTVYLDALAKLTKPYTAEKVEGALREYMVNMHANFFQAEDGIRDWTLILSSTLPWI